jgi:two-component system secretion response regulator SsrB
VVEARPIRVFLSSAHPNIVSALTAFLLAQGDMAAVGVASDRDETLYRCQKLTPDIVVIDLGLAPDDACDTIQALHNNSPHIPIIALADMIMEKAHRALEAGAVACLPQPVNVEALASLIRAGGGEPQALSMS